MKALTVKLPLRTSIPGPFSGEGDCETDGGEGLLHPGLYTAGRPLGGGHEQGDRLLKLQRVQSLNSPN